VEVLARCRLLGPLKLEYTGAALTAPSPAGRDQLKHDFRVAVPLGERGQFHVGAKYRWEAEPGQSAWTETSQLYLGLQLKH
jgi:hypothetical protein